MKIAIVGFGLEGKSSFDYFSSRNEHDLTIHDENPSVEIPFGVNSVLGPDYLNSLAKYDLVVRTSGLQPSLILDKNPGIEARLTTQLNEFLKASPTRKLIAITGTKGKGTTSSLIYEMLKADNKDAYLIGNIGLPMLSVVNKLTPDSFVVLELSSFQLVDLNQSSPHIAACLMVTPEHLDWHPDLNSYLASKANLFSHQRPDDTAIYLAGNELSSQVANHSPGKHIPYFAPPGAAVSGNKIEIGNQEVIKVQDIKLPGKHNLENVCAAVTVYWQLSQNIEAIKEVLPNFSGLEHRLELVKEINGVKYYDDSFGTTPETAIAAIEAFDQPKILIVGGSDKGADYTPLVEAIVNNKVKHIICIGVTGSKIAGLLNNMGETKAALTDQSAQASLSMEQIVKLASEKAQPGDIVLLSTASASFDMFKDYKDRGEQFKAAVQSLATAA